MWAMLNPFLCWTICAVLALPTFVAADLPNGPFENVWDAFSALANLDVQNPSKLHPSLGGQDFAHCCLVAVNQSIEIINGSVAVKPNSFIEVNGTTLLNSIWPCNAVYNGDNNGAPTVTVDYDWCSSTCPGWQISKSSNLKQWVQPLVGFILPAVVFCLAIPRRRRLVVPDWMFPENPTGLSFVKTFVMGLLAAATVTADIIIWLGLVFALSGPLLLSGLYEALLDKRIVDLLRDKIENGHLSVRLRARILYTVLVGNLDIERAWEPTMKLTDNLPGNPIQGTPGLMSTPNPSHPTSEQRSPPVTPLGIYVDGADGPSGDIGHEGHSIIAGPSRDQSPSGMPRDGNVASSGQQSAGYFPLAGSTSAGNHIQSHPIHFQDERGYELDVMTGLEQPSHAAPGRTRCRACGTVSSDVIQETKTRLRAMLACQYSFGSIVGAPVVFYLGSFIYALIEIRGSLGDNDTSHALAFGMWWMSIPHISIISGCLLAGNNPNTLEGIIADPEGFNTPASQPRLKRTNKIIRAFKRDILVESYESHFQPAWMWERGRSKREWVMTLYRAYGHEDPSQMKALRDKLRMDWESWTEISIIAFLLFSIPCGLGFLTSFFTPRVGIGCRSLTFLVYAIAQFCLLLLWIWRFTWRDYRWRERRRIWKEEDKAERERRNPEKQRRGTASDEYSQETPMLPTSDVPYTRPREGSSAFLLPPLTATSPPVQGHPPASPVPPLMQRDGSNQSQQSYGSYIAPPHMPDEKKLTAGSVFFWTCLLITLGAAVFSAIGGTLMQIMGVYRNCLCSLGVPNWISKQGVFHVSTDNRVHIYYAGAFWVPMGSVATAVLGIICYYGWWYQRKLRYKFTKLVEDLDR